MTFSLTTLLLSLSLSFYLTPVSAHGYLNTLTIDGKPYSGPFPSANATLGPNSPSIIRQVRDVSPIQGTSSTDLNCGLGASNTAELVADAKPGSTLQFLWHNGDDQNWTHNIGVMMTYLTSCGSSSCVQFDPVASKAKWFKIHQVGREPNGSNWVLNELTTGTPATVPLPSALAPGNYLVHHEILALQNAATQGLAEFYVTCAQLRVNGSEKGGPTSSELVTFPGAYSPTDQGILDPNVYDPSKPYVFPGPAVAAFVSSGASASTSTNNATNGGGGGGGRSPSSAAALMVPVLFRVWTFDVGCSLLFVAFGLNAIQFLIW